VVTWPMMMFLSAVKGALPKEHAHGRDVRAPGPRQVA
jgi:hypothetical protein